MFLVGPIERARRAMHSARNAFVATKAAARAIAWPGLPFRQLGNTPVVLFKTENHEENER